MALESRPHEAGHDSENDVARRAARELRDSDAATDAHWLEITGRVITRVRAAARHATPIKAESAGGDLYVTDLVVRDKLRVALEGLSGTTPLRIDIGVEHKRCTSLTIELSAAYRTSLPRAARKVRTAAHIILTETLGKEAPTPDAITLHIGDITAQP